MKRWVVSCLLLSMLCGCSAVQRVEAALDNLVYEEDMEDMEPTLEPIPETTPEPFDPDAQTEFLLPEPEDPGFGFYSQLQPNLSMGISRDELIRGLKDQGIETVPTADNVRLNPLVNRNNVCYALEIVGTRQTAESAVKLFKATLLALGVESPVAQEKVEWIEKLLEQQKINELVYMGKYSIRIADMEEAFHIMLGRNGD